MLAEKEEIFLPFIDRLIMSCKMREDAIMGKRRKVHDKHRIELQGMVASALLVLTLFGAQATEAQTFEEASAAYRRGDFAVAFESFLDLAAQGHADAQALVGRMYADGRGVRQDNTEAVRWFRHAAEQGHDLAQAELGFRHLLEIAVPRDDIEAARWVRWVAERGNDFAQDRLGVIYDEGKGVTQDYAEAVRWFRRAAEQGNARAQHALGKMHGQGKGVPQDYAEAVRWHRQAAEQGLTVAQFMLGLLCAAGRGMPQDYVQAHKWINLAAARSSASDPWREDAVQTRDEVASLMTPAQIAEAQRLAREWEPKQASALAPLGATP